MKPEDDFEAQFEDAAAPFVDDIMKENYASPPPGLLMPEKVWRENVRRELTDIATGKEIRTRLNSAQNVILEDLKTNLTAVEFQEFQEDWKQGIEKILAPKIPIIPPEEGTAPPSLLALMGISEKTLSELYNVGTRLFKAKDFKKAADVFFFITLIDYLRHNVWISLGLSEMQNHHWDLAIAAFNMGIMTNEENPVPYLQSAECCLALGNKQEALAYLKIAEEPIAKTSQTSKQAYLDKLHKLQQLSKT